MADIADKYEDNITGKYYCDDQCIDCDLCRETATDNFKRNEDGGYSFVYKQPENGVEEALCKEAMEGCPVEAIGNDGEGSGTVPTHKTCPKCMETVKYFATVCPHCTSQI